MIQHQQTPASTPAPLPQTTAVPTGNSLVSSSAMQLTSPLYLAPGAAPGNAATVPRNWKGEPVNLPPHHIMSPVDLPIDQKPIFIAGPFTSVQRQGFLKGNGARTKISPHHRHQLPVSMGGVIDEIPGPGHPAGNQHTTGNRHPNKISLFRTNKNLRSREIRRHWRAKGKRLAENPPGSGKWYDPGF